MIGIYREDWGEIAWTVRALLMSLFSCACCGELVNGSEHSISRTALITYPLSFGAVFNRPHPDSLFAILVAQSVDVASGKPAPGIISTCKQLQSSQLVAFLCKWPHITVEQVMLLVEVTEQILADAPVLERHGPRVQLVIVQLHD